MWLFYAALASFFFGLRGILYQWTSQRPIDRNIMLFGVYLSGMIVAILANLWLMQPWSLGAWGGIIMGVFSFASNAAMYRGFAEGKASLVAVFVALTPIVVALFAYFLWREALSVPQIATFALIMVGIVLIRYSNDLSLTHLKGVHWALLAMLCFGITDITTKQTTLWQAEALPTLILMYGTGSLLFGLNSIHKIRSTLLLHKNLAASNKKNDLHHGEWSLSRTLLWGMIVGLTNVSGMMLIIPAFRYGITGLVSAVIAMNVLIILLYIRIILREKFTPLELIGMSCAIVGTIILRLLVPS